MCWKHISGVTLKRLVHRPRSIRGNPAAWNNSPALWRTGDLANYRWHLPPAVVETVTSLAFAIDAKDQYTQGHSQKVSAYALMLAQALGMSQAEVEEIRLAALLHDLGKVGIPEAILNKSGPLDATEWETMKNHTRLGSQFWSPCARSNASSMVRHHHECFDGSGYPRRSERRTDSVRRAMIAIADAYDTITSARPTKSPGARKTRSPNSSAAPPANSIRSCCAFSWRPCASSPGPSLKSPCRCRWKIPPALPFNCLPDYLLRLNSFRPALISSPERLPFCQEAAMKTATVKWLGGESFGRPCLPDTLWRWIPTGNTIWPLDRWKCCWRRWARVQPRMW